MSSQSFELERYHNPWECIYSITLKLGVGCCVKVFEVVYLGKTNITGGLSRLNTLRQADGGKERDSARAIVKNSVPVASS